MSYIDFLDKLIDLITKKIVIIKNEDEKNNLKHLTTILIDMKMAYQLKKQLNEEKI